MANGRGSSEALDAATRFSRLGLNRVQVQEAVNVSLRAANVAEITAAEASENLVAIMQAYGLRANELSGVLDRLNTISNTYNVTNKDMFDGIARVGALAAQARLPLSELMGLIATGVGRTGRPGAEFGNAIKAAIVTLSTPEKQKKLKDTFDFSALTPTGEMKDMSTMLSDLYVKYMSVADAEKLHMTQMIGSKQQASRLTAIIDGYVQSQVLAIRALNDTNSAERENANIRATMASQLRSLGSEFQRFSLNMVASTDSSVLTGVIQNTTKGITSFLGVLADHPQMAGLVVAAVGLTAAAMIKMAIAAHQAGSAMNFFSNTGNQFRLFFKQAGQGFGNLTAQMMVSNTVSKELFRSLIRLANATAGIPGVNLLTRGLLGLATAAAGVIGILKEVGGLIKGFLIFEAASFLFTKFFGDAGSGADEAARSAARFNDELVRSGAEMESLGLAARLFKTVGNTFDQRTPRGQREDIEAVAEAAEPRDRTRRQALMDELRLLHEQSGAEAVKARLAQLGIKAQQEQAKAAERNGTQIAYQLRLARDKVQSDSAAVENANRLNLGAEKERKQLEDSNRRLKELEDSRDKNRKIQTEGDADATIETREERKQLFEKRMAVRESGLDRFTRELPAPLDAVDEAGRELNVLRAKVGLEQKALELLKLQGDQRKASAETEAQAAREALKSFRNPQLDEKLERLKDAQIEAEGRLASFDAAEKGFVDYRRGRGKLTKIMDTLDEELPGNVSFEGAKVLRALREQMDAVGGPSARPRLADDAFFARHNANAETLNNAAYSKALAEKEARVDAADKAKSSGIMEVLGQRLIIEGRLTALGHERQVQEERTLRDAQATVAAEEAKRQALAARTVFAVGLTESEQLLNQGRRTMDTLLPNLKIRQQGGDPLELIRDNVQIQDHLLALKTTQNTLEQRSTELQKMRSNELIRQTAEISKHLLMASRDEQIQAAALARYRQAHPQAFTPDQFQFFTQATRETIVKTQPDMAPQGINLPVQEIDREIRILGAGLKDFGEAVREIREKLKGVDPVKAAKDFINAGAKAPEIPAGGVAVNIGAVNVQFAEQYQAIAAATVEATVLRVVQPQIDRIMAQITRPPAIRPATNIAPS